MSDREYVAERSMGICEARIKCKGSQAILFHHRKRRSQGGEDTPANLMHLCSDCHWYIHDHVAWSLGRRYLVYSWDDPRRGTIG